MRPASILLVMLLVGAQSSHHQHHANYQNWVNQANQGCCNNQDCEQLAEANERMDQGVLEVRIEDVWCPVQSWHYLKTGNVPDASVAHVCVWSKAQKPGGPCERMLCYQPKPLM